jgi:anti-sigma regulatory factor (Ser/Thr protein kinase)
MTSPGSRPGSGAALDHGMPWPAPAPADTAAPQERGPLPASAARAPSAMPELEQRWRRVFPGHAGELRTLRQWLAGLLPGVPARDDVIVVAVELATNAVKHTASGRGGYFAVEITWHAQPGTVRIAVADCGAPTGPQTASGPDPFSEHGRGLQVVRGLASRTGACGDHRGRLIWADVPWAGDSPVDSGYPAGYKAALRDGLASLAAEHADVVTWFGRATLQWWALTGQPGTGCLVTAPSAGELASILDRHQARSPRRQAEPAPKMTARAGNQARKSQDWARSQPSVRPALA